ncbi:MAG TPA: hypothetical protein VNH40_12220 [Gaiellaceae bacterium]|nr:hypothetical protein [Gaiellaceae bacterium]
MRPPTGAVALTRLVGLVAIGIVIVVALVFWIGACQGKSKHDEYASYMDSVREIAQSSAKVGQELVTKMASTGLKLADLETSLEQWSQQQQQAYDQAQQIRPPGPLRSLHQRVLDTLQLRALGLAGLANELAQSGSKDAATAAVQLANEAQLLTASDIVWLELYRLPVTQTLQELGVTGVVAPTSVFVTNPDLVSMRAFEVVYERLKPASTGGTPSGLHGDNLVGTKAVGGGRSVTLSTTNPTNVFDSADLKLEATVQDSGNFQEVNVPVTLTIAVAGKTVLTRHKTIPSIQAAERVTVSFGNLQLPADAFGHQATATVRIGGVPGETNLANNRASYPILFRLSQ